VSRWKIDPKNPRRPREIGRRRGRRGIGANGDGTTNGTDNNNDGMKVPLGAAMAAMLGVALIFGRKMR